MHGPHLARDVATHMHSSRPLVSRRAPDSSPQCVNLLQAFGGRNYKTLGLVLQRALLINWAMCIPITVLWTHSEKLLLLLGQQPTIAAGAAL